VGFDSQRRFPFSISEVLLASNGEFTIVPFLPGDIRLNDAACDCGSIGTRFRIKGPLVVHLLRFLEYYVPITFGSQQSNGIERPCLCGHERCQETATGQEEW
jgi:hypothetical protein